MDLIQIMKTLSDETRLRILNLLIQGELCVCELESLLDINQSNASRHLNKLTVANLIMFEKRALFIYYRINKKVYEEYPILIEFLNKELGKLEKCKNDLKRLETYKSSGITCEELKTGKDCWKSIETK